VPIPPYEPPALSLFINKSANCAKHSMLNRSMEVPKYALDVDTCAVVGG